ncbi:MalY/PatB family protein [Priestia koreensis]|uniref:MalY/PatB family protein n=1 Tax=Priestia koreensis TaxID=284581 RepID=UPI00345B0651
MNKHLFDESINRFNTQSTKWDNIQTVFGSDDLLPMWVADMDFKAPQEVIDAVSNRVEHGIFGYTHPNDHTHKAIQRWMSARHGWDIEPSWLTYSPGVVFAISMAVQAFTNEQDKVLIQTPVYPPFFNMVKLNNRTLIENPLLLSQGRYEMDFDDLEAKLSNGVKMMILCSPHNPIGRVWTKEELTKVAELCQRYDVLILSDEIHSDIIFGDHVHTPIASLSDEISDRTITCMAPSKTFNLAGFQASSIIISNTELRQKYTEMQHKQGFFSLNALGITAIEAAYTHGEPWLKSLLNYLEQNVSEVESFIHKELPSLSVIKAEGTYLLWIDCRSLNLTDEDLQKLFVQKGKVGVEPGGKYGEEGRGFIRLNIGCPRSTLMEGLNRIKIALS